MKYNISIWGKCKQMLITEDHTCGDCGLLTGRKRCDFLWDHLLHVSAEHFQTEMPLPAAEAQPSSALCQSHWLPHIRPQWEAIDYAVTSGKFSPPKCVFWRKCLSDQTVPPQITVDLNEFSLNEPDTVWHRTIKFFSNCLDKVEKHRAILQQPQWQTARFIGTC